MKMSTRCRYGLRALADLAVNSRGRHIALYEIAQRQQISLKYLEQEFAMLRKSGLIRSIKGAQGGYMLATEPENIKISDVIRTLEGDVAVIEQVDDPVHSTPIQRCLNEYVWMPINRGIAQRLDTMTLADLIREQADKHNKADMYYI